MPECEITKLCMFIWWSKNIYYVKFLKIHLILCSIPSFKLLIMKLILTVALSQFMSGNTFSSEWWIPVKMGHCTVQHENRRSCFCLEKSCRLSVNCGHKRKQFVFCLFSLTWLNQTDDKWRKQKHCDGCRAGGGERRRLYVYVVGGEEDWGQTGWGVK